MFFTDFLRYFFDFIFTLALYTLYIKVDVFWKEPLCENDTPVLTSAPSVLRCRSDTVRVVLTLGCVKGAYIPGV